MSQLNINLTPEFEDALRRLMRIRGIETKATAVRIAVREALERTRPQRIVDFASWIGLGKSVPENRARHFRSDDDLWSGH